MCLYPQLIKNRKYVKNKKNKGIVPDLPDRRIEYVPIGCQNCMECRKQKARAWQVRLMEEIKVNTNGKFVGFTFSNEAIQHLCEQEITKKEGGMKVEKDGTITADDKFIKCKIKDLKGYEKDNAIATKAMRLFLERWRKKYKKSLRHWAVTELGHQGTENIHMHAIVWTNENLKTIEQIWNSGEVKNGWLLKGRTNIRTGQQINYVNEQTISYMIKYVSKIDQRNKEYKSKVLTSPGIGREYTNTTQAQKNAYQGTKTEETYRTRTGHKITLPIYWRNKIYSEVERERLWTQKLDKEERWVCKEKISIKNGYKEYDDMVKWYRRINHELGYGGLKNENRKAYEDDRREILIETRIQNTKRNGNDKNQ